VFFLTPNPKLLLKTFRDCIDDSHVITWGYDEDGDFTHTAKQWEKLAWMHPVPLVDRLSFFIVPRKGFAISKVVYAVYHGRLIESFLTHCDEMFEAAHATSMPVAGDLIKGSLVTNLDTSR